VSSRSSAATLYIREGTTVAWAATGDAEELGAGRDLFTSNALRARGEVRRTLAIHVPSAFAEVNLAA
jgi:hypothetical protein